MWLRRLLAPLAVLLVLVGAGDAAAAHHHRFGTVINPPKGTVTLLPGSFATGAGEEAFAQLVGHSKPEQEASGSNTAYGYRTLAGNVHKVTTEENGGQNTCVGSTACQHLTGGAYNNAYGDGADRELTTGIENDAFGEFALLATTTGRYNVCGGNECEEANTTGSHNAFLGTEAGRHLVLGNENAAVGQDSIFSNTVGGSSASFNSAIGPQTLRNLTTGEANTAAGISAGEGTTTGSENAFIGKYAGKATTTGSKNVFVGPHTGESNTTNSEQLAIGDTSASPLVEGAFGTKTLKVNGELSATTLVIPAKAITPTKTEVSGSAGAGKALCYESAGSFNWCAFASSSKVKNLGKVTSATETELNLNEGRLFTVSLEHAGKEKFKLTNVPALEEAHVTLLVKGTATGTNEWEIENVEWLNSVPSICSEVAKCTTTSGTRNEVSIESWEGGGSEKVVGSVGLEGKAGAEGPKGTNGTGLAPAGAWSSGVTYAVNEAVTYNGALYASIKATNLNHKPDSEPTWWTLYVAKGEKGEAGGATEITYEAVESLNANIAAAGAPWSTTIRAGKSGDGTVHLDGVVKVNTEVTEGSFAFILPTADRPEKQKACFLTNVEHHNGQWAEANGGLVYILTSGKVELRGKWQTTAEGNEPSFSQCSFPSKG